MVDHRKLPTGVKVENLLPVKFRLMGLSGTVVTGNAVDIVLVRVNTHLLAWPCDLANLSDCSHELFLLFVGSQVGFFVTLTLVKCYSYITVGRQLIFA